MKRGLLAIAVIVAALMTMAVPAPAKTIHYTATLLGDKEVPPVNTKATGKAIFKLTDDGTKLHFRIKTKDLDNATAAHIHFGAMGTNGPVVVVLYPPTSGRLSDGNTLVKGVITAASLTGPLEGKSLADLITAIDAGNAYVNVHTTQHPDGEIRGWIVRKK